MQTTTINIDEIKLNSQYLRTETDVETLKNSIESIGLINPLTINKENELLAGARRYTALKELGITDIPVHVVDRKSLEQELISIDENLVRKPLDKLEFEKCLNRGREIYEELNPTATKIEVDKIATTTEEKKLEKAQEEQDMDSFAAVTAQKTGLSKSVIKGAIKRDALASEHVKKARRLGHLNASQTNEIIKLDKETQEKILPMIADKTVKEAKQIITAAKRGGIEEANQEIETMIPLPKEYAHLRNLSKRLNKNLTRILLEELTYEGKEADSIMKEMRKLQENLNHFFKMGTTGSMTSTESIDDDEHSESTPVVLEEGAQEFTPEYTL
ncbi:ParB-like protein [Halobacteriovorax sp. BALOs_7]|uniref:ParB/RepB/Spo0J family partition protein n=1 Tax=Halobacteriovorax sp. BALOs_7 TaxID=2109558 RepID=UPI000EA0C96C|nr:ParB N-terminal domain-containing protein [Halobacteriovorax sp. BALOs_7]AYF44345.1 ParB-like protein [Halobacteriovorax sp. BALOs_7]